MPRNHSSQRGVIAIIALVGVSAFALAVLVASVSLANVEFQMTQTTASGDQVFFAAESGINMGLNALVANPGAQQFCLTIAGATIPCTASGDKISINIAIDTTDPHQMRRVITSVATSQGKQRTLRVIAQTNALGGNIQYAVQSGTGGIDMAQNSEVRGDFYSNGPVTAANNTTILGNVWSSEVSGTVDVETVGSSSPPTATAKCPNPPPDPVNYNKKELRSHTIAGSGVYGKAFYQTVSGTVKAGTNKNITCLENATGPDCNDNAADPTFTNYPITAQEIIDLKDIADNNIFPSDKTISSDTSLGPLKIEGNLTVTGGTLTLTGPVWVTGTIDINHPGVTVRLPASAGEASGALISDQTIDIKNNAVLQGSGNLKSFLIVISIFNDNDLSTWGIRGANGSTAVIYFSPDDLILVSQTAQLNNTTGKKIQLENNSCIQYNPNLTGFYIRGGTPQPISAISGSWSEQ